MLEARPSLSAEQRRMVSALTGSGDGAQVVVGRAGAGKTFALDAARAAWEASGHRVIGLRWPPGPPPSCRPAPASRRRRSTGSSPTWSAPGPCRAWRPGP